MSYFYRPDRDDEVENYWDDPRWVPRTASGNQRTPNSIRLAFQKYIDESPETQTAILKRIGVNSNSFRKFMNPATYASAWSATSNGTYWAAARLLEAERHRKKTAPRASRKRAPAAPPAYAAAPPDSAYAYGYIASVPGAAAWEADRKAAEGEAIDRMIRIMKIETGAHPSIVYDTCQQLVKKVSIQNQVNFYSFLPLKCQQTKRLTTRTLAHYIHCFCSFLGCASLFIHLPPI